MSNLKNIIPLLFLCLSVNIFSQQSSITITTGAEINIGLTADVCATNWGNISGYTTGLGTQCSGLLPVELSHFTARVEDSRNISLKWITVSEINNKGFEIERKQASGDWLKIAWVDGNGTTSQPVEYIYVDKGLMVGTYTYRLKQIDYNGNFEYFALNFDVVVSSPVVFSLSQNYPNPSNPVSKIDYQIPFSSKVIIKVYDATGRQVQELVNTLQEAGYYEVKFDGSSLSSGVYFYTINASSENGNMSATKKMLLVK